MPNESGACAEAPPLAPDGYANAVSAAPEEKQKRGKEIEVGSGMTVREPLPPTLTAMDHQPTKGLNPSMSLLLPFLRVLRAPLKGV
jgi:hypothetical protein